MYLFTSLSASHHSLLNQDDKRRARELRFQASGLGTTDAVLQDLQEK
jgi:hypothetical protein